jgi:hypothetical protein
MAGTERLSKQFRMHLDHRIHVLKRKAHWATLGEQVALRRMTRKKRRNQAITVEVYYSSCSSFLVHKLRDEVLVLVSRFYFCIAFASRHVEDGMAFGNGRCWAGNLYHKSYAYYK